METLGRKITLECRSFPSCPHYGKRRRVPLFLVVDGVVARPNFYCTGCHLELLDVTDVDMPALADSEQRTVRREG